MKSGQIYLSFAVGTPQLRVGAIENSIVRNDPLTIKRPKAIGNRWKTIAALLRNWCRIVGESRQTSFDFAINVSITQFALVQVWNEKFLFFFRFRPDQLPPAQSKRFGIRRDDPCPPRHDTGAVVSKQFVKGGVTCPVAGCGWEKRPAPFVRAILPPFGFEFELGQSRELLFAFAGRQDRVLHRSRRIRRLLLRPCCQHDADRLLHGLEDARWHVGLMTLRRAIDHPDSVSLAPQIVAHTLESRTVEEARDRDETDDAGVVFRVVIEDLPGGPAPEIDVEVAQMFGVRADA